jgi:hypothetical protein
LGDDEFAASEHARFPTVSLVAEHELAVLAVIPFTAPFAVYDTDSSFDASTSAAWRPAGSTAIEVESSTRVDTVFPDSRIGSLVVASVTAADALLRSTTNPLRPLTLNPNRSLSALAPALRI